MRNWLTRHRYAVAMAMFLLAIILAGIGALQSSKELTSTPVTEIGKPVADPAKEVGTAKESAPQSEIPVVSQPPVAKTTGGALVESTLLLLPTITVGLMVTSVIMLLVWMAGKTKPSTPVAGAPPPPPPSPARVAFDTWGWLFGAIPGVIAVFLAFVGAGGEVWAYLANLKSSQIIVTLGGLIGGIMVILGLVEHFKKNDGQMTKNLASWTMGGIVGLALLYGFLGEQRVANLFGFPHARLVGGVDELLVVLDPASPTSLAGVYFTALLPGWVWTLVVLAGVTLFFAPATGVWFKVRALAMVILIGASALITLKSDLLPKTVDWDWSKLPIGEKAISLLGEGMSVWVWVIVLLFIVMALVPLRQLLGSSAPPATGSGEPKKSGITIPQIGFVIVAPMMMLALLFMMVFFIGTASGFFDGKAVVKDLFSLLVGG